jgi:hypothetical protein
MQGVYSTPQVPQTNKEEVQLELNCMYSNERTTEHMAMLA